MTHDLVPMMVEGRAATVAYLDAAMQLCDASDAVYVEVHFDDGERVLGVKSRAGLPENDPPRKE